MVPMNARAKLRFHEKRGEQSDPGPNERNTSGRPHLRASRAGLLVPLFHSRMISFAVTTLLAETSEYDLLVFQVSCDDHYLAIQRRADLKPSRFGNIRFECDGQMWSGYDVIRHIDASPDRLRIALDPAKATKFEGRCQYDIDLAIDPADKPAALRFLKKLFAGTELLTVSE